MHLYSARLMYSRMRGHLGRWGRHPGERGVGEDVEQVKDLVAVKHADLGRTRGTHDGPVLLFPAARSGSSGALSTRRWPQKLIPAHPHIVHKHGPVLVAVSHMPVR
jgi:hypothetical protein